MFRRPNKKQLFIRRVITYVVMVLAVIVIVVGTILFIMGYRVDSDKGRIEQGALIQFDSQPNGAAVSIDGISINANTPSKQTVVAGQHSFVVTRAKYEDWSKTLNVKAGTLEWLDYIRLVPKDLKVESIETYTSLYGEKSSPDDKWTLVQQKADVPSFQLIDLRSSQVKSSTVVLPADKYSDAATAGVAHTFTMESWDEDGRHMIIKHSFNDKTEYIVMDTQDVATSVNVSSLLNIALSEVEFSGTSGNILYGVTDGVLRKLDLSNATISRGLVTYVKNFDIYKTDVISYTGFDPVNTAHQVAGVYREGDEFPHVLRVVKDTTTPLTIDATRYYSDDYVAISEGPLTTILKGRYPSSTATDNSSMKVYATFNSVANVASTSFSETGSRLVVQSGLTFVGYEVEYKRATKASIAATDQTPRPLSWLDDAYVWAVHDNKLSIREFDGSNAHVIMGMEPGFDATLSQNGKYLYGIAKIGDTYHLQRVMMIL